MRVVMLLCLAAVLALATVCLSGLVTLNFSQQMSLATEQAKGLLTVALLGMTELLLVLGVWIRNRQ